MDVDTVIWLDVYGGVVVVSDTTRCQFWQRRDAWQVSGSGCAYRHGCRYGSLFSNNKGVKSVWWELEELIFRSLEGSVVW